MNCLMKKKIICLQNYLKKNIPPKKFQIMFQICVSTKNFNEKNHHYILEMSLTAMIMNIKIQNVF